MAIAGTATRRTGRRIFVGMISNHFDGLTVVGRGTTYAEAMRRAYDGVAQIHFDGMQYRRDIGRKAIGAVK